MVVSCCAADTEVIGIRSIYKDTPLIHGQWLEVKGKLQFEGVEQGPIIIVESLNPIDKPEESYIYRD